MLCKAGWSACPQSHLFAKNMDALWQIALHSGTDCLATLNDGFIVIFLSLYFTINWRSFQLIGILRTLSRWMHLCTKVLILYRTTGAISMCKCSICQHSWSQTILRFFNKRIWNIHVIKAHSNHALIILQFCCAIQGYILSNINQTVSKLGYYITN